MKKILSSLLILILVFTLSSLLVQAEEVKEGTNTGDLAPDFTLTSLDGEKITLSDLRGKKIFLNFWASTCPPCREEMPDIEKLHTKHDDIEVITVNLGESSGKINGFLMDTNLKLPVLLDKNSRVASSYLVRFIPTTYILDEEGIITEKVTGILTYEQMLEMMGLEIEE